jgi:hypothetical protein
VEFKVDGNKATLYMGVEDISKNSFLFKTHREYIAHQFKAHGFEITKWNWEQNKDLPVDPNTGNYPWVNRPDGLDFKSTDRTVDLTMEITGTVGVNIRRI